MLDALQKLLAKKINQKFHRMFFKSFKFRIKDYYYYLIGSDF